MAAINHATYRVRDQEKAEDQILYSIRRMRLQRCRLELSPKLNYPFFRPKAVTSISTFSSV